MSTLHSTDKLTKLITSCRATDRNLIVHRQAQA